MSKSRRVITIHLPHREPALAAIFTLLLVMAALLAGLSPYLPDRWTEEEPVTTNVLVPNTQLAGKALNERVENLLGKMTLEEKS